MSKSCCEIAEKPINARRNESLKKLFWIVLLINLGMFLLEALSAFSSHSNALLADSLDVITSPPRYLKLVNEKAPALFDEEYARIKMRADKRVFVITEIASI